MATSVPVEVLSSLSARGSDERGRHVPDEEDVARWGAFYESLPVELREGLDEIGREIARGMPKR